MIFGQAGILASLIWRHPANEGRRGRALARSAAWQLYKRANGRPLDVSAFGYRFRCYPDSHDASRMIYFSGNPDPSEMAFIRRYLKAGDRVIDAGANIGIYTLLFASLVGSEGKVLAFEPDPGTAARLRENITRNRLTNIAVREAALADKPGAAEFTQGADTGNTLYSLKTFGRPSQTVEVTTFDDEIGRDRYALCKMDIEGAELSALSGASKALRKCNPPVWIMELSEKSMARSGHSVADVADLLKSFGYNLWRYHLTSGSLEPFVSQARKPGQVGDGIAIADAALADVAGRTGINLLNIEPASGKSGPGRRLREGRP